MSPYMQTMIIPFLERYIQKMHQQLSTLAQIDIRVSNFKTEWMPQYCKRLGSLCCKDIWCITHGNEYISFQHNRFKQLFDNIIVILKHTFYLLFDNVTHKHCLTFKGKIHTFLNAFL